MKFKQSRMVDGMSFAKPDYFGTFKEKAIQGFKEKIKLALGTVGVVMVLYLMLLLAL
jgi:hypothetical protein